MKLSATTEEISATYAQRFDIERADEWFMLKLQEEMGKLTHILLLARSQGVDLDSAITDKWLHWASIEPHGCSQNQNDKAETL